MTQNQRSNDRRPRWLANWMTRHQHPVSRRLHLIGIPPTIVAIVLAIVYAIRGNRELWWLPVVLLVGGYLLQWVGHLIEGNDMGEIVLIKKTLGLPYVAVSPRYAEPTEPNDVRS